MGKPRSPKGRALRTNEILKQEYINPDTELVYNSPFQLLIATILAAQSTDVGVNKVTPKLFETYPDPESLAQANPGDVEKLIGTIGLYKTKARRIISCSQKLVSDFDGEVPDSMESLIQLDGVGRKTANVVLSVAFGLPGLPVDTHVTRLSNLLGLVDTKDPVDIEMQLNEWIPPDERGDFSHRLILHGRRVCKARRPKCDECVLSDICPSAG